MYIFKSDRDPQLNSQTIKGFPEEDDVETNESEWCYTYSLIVCHRETPHHSWLDVCTWSHEGATFWISNERKIHT